MNNEAILNKLVELGHVKELRKLESGVFLYESGGCSFGGEGFNAFDELSYLIIQDALVSECEKQGIEIQIMNSQIRLFEVHELFVAEYSRQAIIEAFCKVTGVE